MTLATLRLDTAVPDAPFQPGAKVLVLVDSLDETADSRFHGMAGRVVGLFFDDPGSQFPSRPLIEVEVSGVGVDLFFANELLLLA